MKLLGLSTFSEENFLLHSDQTRSHSSSYPLYKQDSAWQPYYPAAPESHYGSHLDVYTHLAIKWTRLNKTVISVSENYVRLRVIENVQAWF